MALPTCVIYWCLLQCTLGPVENSNPTSPVGSLGPFSPHSVSNPKTPKSVGTPKHLGMFAIVCYRSI